LLRIKAHNTLPDQPLGCADVVRLARIFSTDPATVRRMAVANIAQSSRRLIANEPGCNCAHAAIRPTTNRGPFFEASFSAGASPVRFAGAYSRTLAGVTAPLISVTIAMLH
jgi:hypothetical protein